MIRKSFTIISVWPRVSARIYYLIRPGSGTSDCDLSTDYIIRKTDKPSFELQFSDGSCGLKMNKKKCFTPDKLVCYVMGLLVVVAATAAVIMIVRTSICDSQEVDFAEKKPIATPWGFKCVEDKCVRTLITVDNWRYLDSLSVCHLKCERYGTLLPQPTIQTHISDTVEAISVCGMEFIGVEDEAVQNHLDESIHRFFQHLEKKKTEKHPLARGSKVRVEFKLAQNNLSLTLDTDESYKLQINGDVEHEIKVLIEGETYFGLRHGLESLAQLIVYDNLQYRYKIPKRVEIEDRPAYRHRGILLDTVRQFYTVDSIKRTLDTMAIVKLNVFHWHITDANSYPMKLKNFPDMARFGAYGPHKVYTVNDMKEVVIINTNEEGDYQRIIFFFHFQVVRYARVRGIRVIPEFDAPAHVAEGWQLTDFVTCYNAQPWSQFCAGPPCGQLDPTRADLYNVLEEIYREMNEVFDYPDMFHMGGDEVYPSCWNTSTHIQQWMIERGWQLRREDFVELWNHFQSHAHERLKAAASQTRAILWTGTLTEPNFVERFLPQEDYIIQVWTEGSGAASHVPHLLARGYDLIISNSDALYLDCGFGLYVDEGVNWCSPYKPWSKIYNNNITAMGGERREQILGAEACLWSSISSEDSLDSRLWPRASALAERLWSDPETNFRGVERRILLHRRDLINLGIAAESIQPDWCLQNPFYCVR
ncbi:chitooligosaccharidolytic beta-N-acetylglucosaminidase-like isoform X1 [Lutzomyia longipalpis]|uniref:chitooligosaccharidolytic beta-N-acetylglucosaminidase-like isoform X1 n=1 Tax=Lutzomyia longipalpis TaxID=7200 RepID=UPI002483FC11|nr:chitooligosaccharidolytic beta-N-acetylglucosaminidase-like isoform X1 [Lutzomyia longipalpis]